MEMGGHVEGEVVFGYGRSRCDPRPRLSVSLPRRLRRRRNRRVRRPCPTPALRTLAQLVIASDTTVLSAGGATRWATMSAGFSGDYGLRNGLGNGGGKTQADSGEGRDTRRAVGRGRGRSRGSYKCQHPVSMLSFVPSTHLSTGFHLSVPIAWYMLH
ncbi:hypothetical protein B0H10DRAFT_1966915 [Mycena sp. CBHHK59/15]|nr:hypothetical protein B0H10DRAFT_1966915 [Mycena sp. CBHHK59/15]